MTKGIFAGLSVGGIVSGLILLAVAFRAAAKVLREVRHGANNVAGVTGLPLASFFTGGSGVIMLAIMAGLLIATLGVIGIVKYGSSR